MFDYVSFAGNKNQFIDRLVRSVDELCHCVKLKQPLLIQLDYLHMLDITFQRVKRCQGPASVVEPALALGTMLQMAFRRLRLVGLQRSIKVIGNSGPAQVRTHTPLIPNIGNTIWLRSNEDDPDFSLAARFLSDGKNNQAYTTGNVILADGSRFHYLLPVELMSYEQELFFGGVGGPDFAGYKITGIGMRVSSASITQSGVDSYNCNYDVTFLIEGEPVPEPGALLGLGSLLATLGGCVVRRRIRENRDAHDEAPIKTDRM